MDADEIKRLPPKERMKKLKEIEEKRKKEIEKAQKLITETEHVIEEEEFRREIPIDQIKAESIGELFSPEAKEIFKAKRYVSEPKKEVEEAVEEPEEISLEDVVEEAKTDMPEEEINREYKNVAKELQEGKPSGYTTPSGEAESPYKSGEESLVDQYKEAEGGMPAGYESAAEKTSGTYKSALDILDEWEEKNIRGHYKR